MDFELSETQRLLRETVREFTRREVAPIAEEIDRETAGRGTFGRCWGSWGCWG